MGELLLVVANELLAVHFVPSILVDEAEVFVRRIERHRLAQPGNRLVALPAAGLVGRKDFLLLLVHLDELKARANLANQGVLHSPFPGQLGDDVHKKGGAPT